MSLRRFTLSILAGSTLAGAAAAAPVGTAFTYQGQLTQAGAPATGLYDLQVCLYASPSDAIMLACAPDIDDAPVEAGVFTVDLDFGDTPFVDQERYLELRVRPGASTGTYTTLSPRQPIRLAPYAIRSRNATSADTLNGVAASDMARLSQANVFTGTNTFNAGLSANGQSITNVATPTASTDAANKSYVDAATASGSAGGDLAGSYPNPTIASTAGDNIVTAVNASSATLDAARLPDAIAYENGTNTFTGANTFNTGLSANGQRVTNVATPTASTDAANKSYVDAATASGSAGGDLAGSYPNPTIASTAGGNIVTAINASNATVNAARLPGTLAYQGGTNTFTGTNTFNAGLSANGQRITNVATPTATTDAANKSYVDAVTATGTAGGDLSGSYPNPTIASTAGSNVVTAINASSATVNAARLPGTIAYQSGTNTFTGTNTFNTGLSANSQRITSVATPTTSTDAANKAYVDTREMWVEVDEGHTFTTLGSGSVFASEYHVVNVANYTQIKMVVHVAVAGSAGSQLRVNYQQTGGGWSTLVGSIDLSSTGTKETTYTTLAAGVISKGLIRIVAIGSGGDGTASPEVQGVAIMLK